jgi:hypothetical protein
LSFVGAINKEAAVEQLDEIANAEGCPITQGPEFQIHLKLTDNGGFAFKGWGEFTEDLVWHKLYPRLYDAWRFVWDDQEQTNDSTLKAEQEERVRRALQEERERVQPKDVSPPDTEIGKDLKRMSGMPTSLVNKIVRQSSAERLKNFKPQGKRH